MRGKSGNEERREIGKRIQCGGYTYRNKIISLNSMFYNTCSIPGILDKQ